MASPPPLKTATHWLLEPSGEQALAWTAELKRLLAFQVDWEGALFAVGASSRVTARAVKIQNPIAIIQVSSAASRSRLQFLGPELLAYLQSRGWQLNTIEYRIQGMEVSVQGKSLTPSNVESLRASTHNAPDAFKQALAELRAHAQRVGTRGAKNLKKSD